MVYLARAGCVGCVADDGACPDAGNLGDSWRIVPGVAIIFVIVRIVLLICAVASVGAID
jgi:hypothetical protein